MKNGMDVLSAFAVGRIMAGTNGDDALAAVEKQADNAKMAAVIQIAKDAQKSALEAQQNAKNWRQYAGRLRTNLDARKMSEAVLLEELKTANVNHPLATEEGFSAMFDQALATQYGSDAAAFYETEAERMRKSVEEGRMAVS